MKILDTTLRDGVQGSEISFSVSDKLNIVKILDDFGVSYIEAGNPSSNPKDLMFFEEVKKLELKTAKLCAFGSTRRKDVSVHDDANLKAVLKANTDVVVIFGKSWDLHVTEVLKASLEENLAMIYDTIQFLATENKKEVIFDAEHFFDGYKANKEYAIKVIETAIKAGAYNICLCDTNGGVLPNELSAIVKDVIGRFPNSNFGIHAHNDCGVAVANSIVAAEAGISQIQGTFIGFGERCGNADLSCIIPNLILKLGIKCDGNLSMLSKAAAAISEISNMNLESNKPYVGVGAFAHKAGMHADGVLKNSVSFEHVNPEAVGNKRRFLISEVSGKGAVLEKIKPYAELDKNSPLVKEIIDKLKELEHFGYQFEAADASFELLVRKVIGTYKKHFSLVFYKTIEEFPAPEGELPALATIKVEVDGKTEMTAASGHGPVNALDLALRKALSVFYPSLSKMHLTDYKVRVLEQNNTTAAKVRVLIESTDGISTWTTVGVSNDIIKASLTALIDSIDYKLLKEAY